MKYTTEIIINKPVEKCFSALENLENMKHWQLGFENVEHISGIPRAIGSKIKLNYRFGKRKMSLEESVMAKEKNHCIHFNFNTKGLLNIQENFFEKIDKTTTKWICINEFIPTNFSARIMLFLMPKAFKKQSKKYLTDFKNFVENGSSLIHP